MKHTLLLACFFACIPSLICFSLIIDQNLRLRVLEEMPSSIMNSDERVAAIKEGIIKATHPESTPATVSPPDDSDLIFEDATFKTQAVESETKTTLSFNDNRIDQIAFTSHSEADVVLVYDDAVALASLSDKIDKGDSGSITDKERETLRRTAKGLKRMLKPKEETK